MKIAWMTDIHLEFLDRNGVEAFLAHLASLDVDGYLIGGDISNANNLMWCLQMLDDACGRPIFFVLGNHDYYYGSVAAVREMVYQLCRQRPRLVYLTNSGVQHLGPHVALIGHDGWADGQEGDYFRSTVMLNDYKLIAELAPFTKLERKRVLEQLAQEAAEYARRVLPAALAQAQSVLFLTHVPPWRAAAWHNGQAADDEWAPHFSCPTLGEALEEIMENFPQHELTVLCGHTHSDGFTQPRTNITVFTGGAQYGNPQVNRIIDISALAVGKLRDAHS